MEGIIFTEIVGYPLEDGFGSGLINVERHNMKVISHYDEGKNFYKFFIRICNMLENKPYLVKTNRSDVNNLLPKLLKDIPSLMFFEDSEDYYYNPKRGINLFYTKNVSDLLHEISHYLVANKKQRNMINYGLGVNIELLFNSSIVKSEIDTDVSELHIPEFISNILTIICCQYYGYDIFECMRISNVDECFMRLCYIDDIANALQFLTLLNIISWIDDQPILTFKLNQS